MWGRHITTGAILVLAAIANGLPLADDAHLVMGGHYKTSLGKRAEQVAPQAQPGPGLPPPVLQPTTTTPLVPPPGAATPSGVSGTTSPGGKNPPVGQRPPAPGNNPQPMLPTGSASNSVTPTLLVSQEQPESRTQGTSGSGSPSPTGVKPSERKEKTGSPGGAREEDQNTPPQNNSKSQSKAGSSSKPKPKPTGSTDLPGALPPSGGVPTGGVGITSANGVPTEAAPVPSPLGSAVFNPPVNTVLGSVSTPIVPGGVSSATASIPGHIRPTTTPPIGPPVAQGLQPSAGSAGHQFVVDPLNTPLGQTVSTPPGQVTPLADPAAQNPPLPGSFDPTLTQPLGATGNQPPAPQQIPALARRQQVNGLNPEKASTTSASKSTKPKKEEDGGPELRYELAEDYTGAKAETVGVSGSSSTTSPTTARAPTSSPAASNGQLSPQQVGGPQLYNPPVWVPPQLLYESVGGMVDTPVFYPNIYPPPNPGPVVMVGENTRTTAGSKTSSTSPPAPTGSGPALVHESIDTGDPDAAVIKVAPLPHDPLPTSKVRGRDLTFGPSGTLRKVRRRDFSTTSPYDYTDTPPSNTPPPNTPTQGQNPGLLYESFGDGKDPVALPIIADVSDTTTSATTGPSQGPALRYEYGAGDNYPGAGIPSPISLMESGSAATVYTSAQPTGGGPALKYEHTGAENQQPGAYVSTVTTTVYRPQPTSPPPVLEYEYAGAENPVANPFTSTTTITHTSITTPTPGSTGQPRMLYEYASNGDPSGVAIQSTTTNFVTSYATTPTSTTPIPQVQQLQPKPPVLRYENAEQGVTDTRATPTPTGGPPSHNTHLGRKRNETHERGLVGVDSVGTTHNPGDHGKRVRRSRQFRA